MTKLSGVIGILLSILLTVACGQNRAEIRVAVSVETAALLPSTCTGAFVRHDLDHITTNAYEPINMYDSNGAGVAVNDLDNDGDIDIVLANLGGENHIFWNEGDLTFTKQSLRIGSSWAAGTVDVDADGLLDIVFTMRTGRVAFWRNQGKGAQKFGLQRLDGVGEYAYSMAWGDLDGDLDLDLVTGSYDSALEKELRDTFMFGDGAGVFLFTQNGDGTFTTQQLAEKSQALAIQLFDVNGDGRQDILIGNDFVSVDDYAFVATDDGWDAAEPFPTTTENTMSYDAADINNDGTWELLSVDMHPYAGEHDIETKWKNVEEIITPNVLYTKDRQGRFTDQAVQLGVAHTGWSWSTKFGDLNQDGYVDLYSVNGMASADTFAHLPDFTLVEQNQALRNMNDGSGRFVPAPEWGLGDTAGGRGMSMADLDGDGDLDIVVNNLLSNAAVFENQLCEGHAILVDLMWEESPNPFAVGAMVEMETDDGTQQRDVRVMSGYLSGDSTRLHFGVADGVQAEKLVITWPDGGVSAVDVTVDQHIKIKRNNQ